MSEAVRLAGGDWQCRPADDHPFDGFGLLDADTPPARPWPQLIDDLLALHVLPDDWDGQGADAPPPALVDGAIALAQEFRSAGVAPADRVIAGLSGTVIFEWHAPAGYLEVEVTAPGEAEGRWVARGSAAAEAFVLSRRS